MGAIVAGGLTGLLNQSSAQVIDGSLKFDSGSSNYLNRTPSSSGNRRTWTWSGWVKRNKLGATQFVFEAGSADTATDRFLVRFQSDDTLLVTVAQANNRLTSQVFRDVSSWGHLVIAVDTTQSTANDRSKIYWNGSQITDFSTITNPNQDAITAVNSAAAHSIGKTHIDNSNYLDGYQSNIYLIDGQALGPENFGFTDPLTGTWRPKKFSGDTTYPNNINTNFSSSLSASSGFNASYPANNAFDGNLESFASSAGGSQYLELSSSFTGVTSLRIQCAAGSGFNMGGETYTISGTGITSKVISTDGEAKSLTSISLTSTTISGIRVTSSSGLQARIVAIEINGIILKNNAGWGLNGFYLPMDGNSPIGHDKSNLNPVNNRMTWSSMCSGTEYSSTYSYEKAFDGSTSTVNFASNGNTITFTPTGGIVSSGNILVTFDNGSVTDGGGSADFQINGSSVKSFFQTAITAAGGGSGSSRVATITGITNITSMSWSRVADNDLFGVRKIEVGGVALVDGVYGNSWTPVNFGGSVALPKATGALPILNTDGGGNVARPGTRTDPYASSIVMAIPFLGNANDISADIKGSGSNLSVTTSGSPAADSDPVQWYGSSFNVSTNNYINTIGTTSTFAFLHQPEVAGTIEGWINTNAVNVQGPWFQTSNGTNEIGVMFRQNSSTNLAVQINRGTSGNYIVIDSSITIALNTWYHWAFVKSADGYAQFFLNGVATGNKVAISAAAGASNPASTSATSNNEGRIAKNNGESRGIGANICDYRAYTVQKYAFDTSFIPASTSPDILPDTPSGVSGGSKLAKVTDGAVSFDGSSGTSLTINSAGSMIGTNDFTVEFFIYSKSTDDRRVFSLGQNNGSGSLVIMKDSDGIRVNWEGNGASGGDLNVVNSGWHHVAAVRNINNLKVYIDGKLDKDYGTVDVDFDSGTLTIGDDSSLSNQELTGIISNLRVVQSALYTAAFTPPTRELTNVTNTKLLCCQSNTSFNTGAQPILNTNSTGITTTSGTRGDSNSSSIVLALPLLNNLNDVHADIKGSGSNKTVIANGNAAASSAQSKYYGGSYVFDGNGDYLSSVESSDEEYNFSNSNWTVEYFSYCTSEPTDGASFSSTKSFSPALRSIIVNQNSGNLQLLINTTGSGGWTTVGTTANTLNVWRHIALVRSSGTTTFYVDGISRGSSTDTPLHNASTDTVYFGINGGDGTGYFGGYLQDIRIYQGVAKYTSDFTVTAPSVEPIAAVSPSSLLGAGNAAATNFNPFTTDINAVRGQETGYCTMNPLDKGSTIVLSNGNLDFSRSSGGWANSGGRGTFGVSSGKYYWEFVKNDSAAYTIFGVAVSEASFSEDYGAPNNETWSYISNSGNKLGDSYGGAGASYGASFTAGDAIGVALDADAGTLSFYKNGVNQGIAFYTLGGKTLFPHIAVYGATDSATANFGQKPFKFPPPDGFQPLNAANVRPETVITRPDHYVGAITYSGVTNSGDKNITSESVQFTPDLVWVKVRTGGNESPFLYDTVRGDGSGNKRLKSDSNLAQTTYVGSNDLEGFVKGGFIMNGNNGHIYYNGYTHVAWCWRAGGRKNTFTVDNIGYANASDVGMNVGGLNSATYNQTDQTWSNFVTGSAYSGFPFTNAFSGNLSNRSMGANNAGGLTFKPPSAITVSSSLRVYFGYADSSATNAFIINGIDYSSLITSTGAIGWVSFPGITSITSIFYGVTSGGGETASISAIEVDGKILVDSGVTPPNVPSIANTGASVGTKQGFSIVTWDVGSLNGTLSLNTGLTQAPEFVITKVLDHNDDWLTFHKELSSTESLVINGNRAKLSNAAYAHSFNSNGTISGLVVPNWWIANKSYVFYSWHSVPGLQKFGKYEGNTTEGAFVELGFRPAILWIKAIDQTWYWNVHDNQRGPINPIQGNFLRLDSNAQENAGSGNNNIDFLSNGFKIRSTTSQSEPTNVNGQTYIYCAWAEAPAFNLFGGQSNAR